MVKTGRKVGNMGGETEEMIGKMMDLSKPPTRFNTDLSVSDPRQY